MMSIELLKQYSQLTQGQPAHAKDIDVVASIVADLCQRVSRLPQVSEIEPRVIPYLEGGYYES